MSTRQGTKSLQVFLQQFELDTELAGHGPNAATTHYNQFLIELLEDLVNHKISSQTWGSRLESSQVKSEHQTLVDSNPSVCVSMERIPHGIVDVVETEKLVLEFYPSPRMAQKPQKRDKKIGSDIEIFGVSHQNLAGVEILNMLNHVTCHEGFILNEILVYGHQFDQERWWELI
ncbi:hypothetical protein B0H14DRAFT_2577896 [Mycena olivaceomarginata]|nr:hypothetical protein B0H14DRAFT_2577896 [Mycena olivaceomarginata]